MQKRSKQEAYKSIAATNYVGPRRGFDISTFTIHQHAHQAVSHYGEPVPENKKVCNHIQGMTPSAHLSNF